MPFLIVLLAALAGISLGLRATALLMDRRSHPIDRLAMSIVAGGLLTAVVLEIARTSGVFELALGLLLSLSPVGIFDLAKWWFPSKGRRAGWLRGSASPRWVVATRWLFLVVFVVGVAAMAGAMTVAWP